MLIATAGGLVTGVLALVTLHGQNVDAAASQRKTIAVEAAASAFGKNVESLLGALANIQLYPAAAEVINQGMAANKKAISDSLATLSTELKDDPTGVATVAKAQTDWTAFLGWMTQSRSIKTPAELAKATQEYNALYGALSADENTLQQRAGRCPGRASASPSRPPARRPGRSAILLGAGVLLSLLIGFRVANRVRGACARSRRWPRAWPTAT